MASFYLFFLLPFIPILSEQGKLGGGVVGSFSRSETRLPSLAIPSFSGTYSNSNFLWNVPVKEHSLLTSPLVSREIFSMLVNIYIMVAYRSALVTFPPDFSEEVRLSMILRLSGDGKSPGSFAMFASVGPRGCLNSIFHLNI
ncbi:hypothetical protein ACFX1Q_023127 [Malus domestica]